MSKTTNSSYVARSAKVAVVPKVTGKQVHHTAQGRHSVAPLSSMKSGGKKC